MLFVHPPEKVLDVERQSFPSVERANTFIDVSTKPPKPLDVREEAAADLFLIGLRQTSDFRNGLFKRLDHAALYSTLHTVMR